MAFIPANVPFGVTVIALVQQIDSAVIVLGVGKSIEVTIGNVRVVRVVPSIFPSDNVTIKPTLLALLDNGNSAVPHEDFVEAYFKVLVLIGYVCVIPITSN